MAKNLSKKETIVPYIAPNNVKNFSLVLYFQFTQNVSDCSNLLCYINK